MSKTAGPAGQAVQDWIDDAGQVVDDVRCVRCGYNLRTQAATGACPECGRLVTDSTPLYACDRRWLRRVQLGVLVLALGLLARWTTEPVCWCVANNYPSQSWWPGEPTLAGESVPWAWRVRLRELLALLAWTIPPVISFAGLWLVTTRSNSAGRRGDIAGRTATRRLAWLVFANPVWRLVFLDPRTTDFMVARVTACLPFLCEAAIALVGLRYLCHLVRHMSRRWLGFWARWLLYATAVTVLMGTAGGAWARR